MPEHTPQSELNDLIESIDSELGLDDIDLALAQVDEREKRAEENMRRTRWKIDGLACIVQEQHCITCGNTMESVVGFFVREQRTCDAGKRMLRLDRHPGLDIRPLPRVVETSPVELVPWCRSCWESSIASYQLALDLPPRLDERSDLGRSDSNSEGESKS